MTRSPLVSHLAVLLVVAPLLPCQEPPSVTWLAGIPAAEEAAARTGKPMLLVFRCEP